MSGRDSGACSQRTRSGNAGIDAFVDRRRESSERSAGGGVANSEEGVGTDGPRLDLKGPPECMRLVRRFSGEGGQRMAG